MRGRAVFAAIAAAALLAPPGADAQALRPSVVRALQQAADLLEADQTAQAMKRVQQAETVRSPNAAEQVTIARMKGAIAQRSGDHATVITAFSSAFADAAVDDKAALAEAIAYAHAQLEQWPQAQQWVQRAVEHGGSGAPGDSLRELQAYVQARSGDFAAVARTAAAAIAAAEGAGKRPDDADLRRLADAQQRLGQPVDELATLTTLLIHHPGPEAWRVYLDRLARRPGFGSRHALDLLRLRQASGTLTRADEVTALAERALRADLPDEALAALDRGLADGVWAGDDTARAQRLRELALKSRDARHAALADDLRREGLSGDQRVDLGYALATTGRREDGMALIERAIAAGSLKRPHEAALRLGMLQIRSPATREAGLKRLRGVTGDDGIAEIAQAWILLTR